MSIASEIARLTNDKNNIRASLIAKGVRAASGHGYDDFAEDISNVPGGGNPNVWLKDNGDNSYTGSGSFTIGTILDELTIPNGFTTIGNGYFQNGAMTKVILPDTITTIGTDNSSSSGPFDGCSQLVNLNLGTGVTLIGRYAFRNTVSLSAVTLPTSITKICQNAFNGSGVIMSGINLPNCTEIAMAAFYHCTNITGDVNLPSLTTVDRQFLCGTGINRVMDLGSVTSFPRMTGGSYNANTGCFGGCLSLTEVHLPATVTTLQASTFYGCTNLTSVYILAPTPPTLENVNAFFGCNNLAHIYVPSGSESDYQGATNWKSFSSIIEGTL